MQMMARRWVLTRISSLTGLTEPARFSDRSFLRPSQALFSSREREPFAGPDEDEEEGARRLAASIKES